MSISHLGALQKDVDQLKKKGKLSCNTTYRGYLKDLRFAIPKNLPDAKSLVVIAVPSRLMLARFHLDGNVYDVPLPPNYHRLTDEFLEKTVMSQIIGGLDGSYERARWVHLKLLAVRSGLGKYGRNNLCYVEGMGSLLRLAAYFTNCKLEDSWDNIRLMEICQSCKACKISCPTHCMTEENFVIDAGRCISLYNEVEGRFPEWISPKAHNALMGCMICQSVCPANREVLALHKRLDDITEEETSRILKGERDQALLNSLAKKLGSIYPIRSPESFQILARNLRAFIDARV
ncbi:MAG: epoxyqueuosine reductase [Candidatus Bathyarchaeota archaeon]|nr:MAG: epoxyqueuosine reductase [Candidatus Bathyarchaeota archaeon]